MHHIRFCPRPHWGRYSAPQTPWLDLRGIVLREGRAGKGIERTMGGQKREGEKGGRKGEMRWEEKRGEEKGWKQRPGLFLGPL